MPYEQIRAPLANFKNLFVMKAIREKELPERPTSLSEDDTLWQICIGCWNYDPDLRMSVDQIINTLMDHTTPTLEREAEICVIPSTVRTSKAHTFSVSGQLPMDPSALIIHFRGSEVCFRTFLINYSVRLKGLIRENIRRMHFIPP